MAMKDKIRAGRRKLKLTQAELADKLAVSTAAVGQWETAATAPTQENLAKLADLIGESLDWFHDRANRAPATTRAPEVLPSDLPGAALISIRGTVQAGIWRHVEPDSDYVAESIRVPLDRSFDGLRVFGLRVAGASMNLVYPPGTILICVKLMDVGREPRHGERVIVLRHRDGDGSELTVKEFRRDPDGRVRLYPRSTHPDFQEPIEFTQPGERAATVEVQALVIASLTYEV
jgi:repressor LexA